MKPVYLNYYTKMFSEFMHDINKIPDTIPE